MEIQKFAKSVLHRKTKTEDLRRTGSWKPSKKSTLKFLSRTRSEPERDDTVEEDTESWVATLPDLPPMRPRSAWNFDDDTDSTTSSETMTSVSDDGSVTPKSSQLYYTTPPKANMVRNQDEKRLEGPGSSLYRIPRRLSQKDKIREDLLHERQRSVSLDCGDGRTIKVFMSNAEGLLVDDAPGLHHTNTAPVQLRSMNGLSSPNRSSKILTTTPKKRGSTSNSSNSDPDSLSPNKMYDKRKSDKDKKSPIDASALFDAVEQQDLDLVKNLLEVDGLNINSVNSEGLTPLDVAVMTNNIPMAKMLLFNGARESPLFLQEEARSDRLDALVSNAEKRVVDLSAAILNASSGSGSNTQQKENEKQLSHWEFRHKLLKRMKAGYDHARTPDPPSYVSLTVASSSSLLVKFDEPLNHNGAVVTRYKVEWSCFDDFIPLAGEDLVEDMRHLEHEIKGLVKGNKYYVRVAACNMKGYSEYSVAKPAYAVPSSWRDVDNSTVSRTEGKLKLLDELFSQVKHLRPADASELKDNVGDSPLQRKRKSLKNLFTSAPKFYKSLKRGVYLACLLYHGDKVLVTSDDQLPVVEVDENFSGPSVNADLHWLMKISCTWDDVKSLRQDMEKNTSAGTMHFRYKLLQAVSVLQGALGIYDLGQFHFKPLKDSNGCIVLTTVCNIRDPKSVILGSSKWVSFAKLLRRSSGTGSEPQESLEVLVSSVSEMILYHQVSNIRLAKGLYLGYLKLQASLELNRVLVPKKAPNILPNIKVRDCSNVSREEWQWLQSLNTDQQVAPPTQTQEEFRKQLKQAAQKLFNILDISENFAASHRIYDVEVIEFSNDVSFLLILPPVEEVCLVPGQNDSMTEKKDLTLLPVQVFEMIHMCTYQPQLINRYSRLSSILDMDLCLAQQVQREAFSTEELTPARERVEKLSNIMTTLDKSWKSTRWIMDIITYARDKSMRGGILMSEVTSPPKDVFSTELESPSQVDLFDNNNSQSGCPSVACDSNEISVGKDNIKIAKFYDPNEEVPKTNGHVKKETAESEPSAVSSGILQVYAAYETGLSRGTRVRLHVTEKTTSREVINLVVRQLNKTLTQKGHSEPLYGEDQLEEFCLVAVIGARERILRDDYQPLQLQNPWTKGRLYVRMKSNLLAAIQQGHATEV
ncbi:ankyrin repeat and fibronectin type-III domain-containing protein 1-like isoform X2 [Saccostrea echinata]|uniref:ankyrin repeat and fibronectin type-III domain-containing protein 1-like isoform X2 n=1 Tax=Saccostrea echinata TaxID=191078 RepID=UPI002A82C5C2|nr:ankyrin repeat and fibronectin type-III domain-containing protein 1-like isoform X2 [Saccostrea echinata]